MLISSVVCGFLISLISVVAEDILVSIPNGQIRGRKEYSLRGISFYAFQQIPYAQPPLGNLRFKPPQPALPWNGVLDATANTKICYQRSNMYNVPNLTVLENEDCLYLNVYTPSFPSQDVFLPVMFYIYGGGFVNGASSFDFFGPHYLMENDVIVVTINYRVGPFGFLSTGDEIIPGNFGLKDQLLGLQWVKDNIQYFGGDPNKVTIFGQSAGAASVAYLLTNKKAEGYFRAAIQQSGSTISPWAYQRDHKNIAYKLATYVDSNFDSSSTSEQLLSFLQGATAEEINAAALKFHASVGTEEIIQGFWFAPVLEPATLDTAFITEEMYSSIENGLMNRVPLMIGICSEEAIARAINLASLQTLVARYDSDVAKLVNKNMHITDSAKLTEAGEAIRDIYTDGLLQDHIGLAIRYFSDMSFNRGVIRHAQLQSQYSDVYFYQFSYHGTIAGNRPFIDGAYRVGHAEDNHYLWAVSNHTYLNKYPASDILASDRYRALFTNFAKYLNPPPEQTTLFENIIWPKLTPNSLRYLDINESLTIKSDPKGDVYPKWVSLYDERAVKPLDTY